MQISGYVETVLEDRLIVELSRRQKIDVFITPNRKELLHRHVIIKGSMITFAIILQTVEVKGDNLGKLWLDYIIFPTEIKKPEPEKEKGNGKSWAEGRMGK